MKAVEIKDLEIMWQGFHEAMDAAAFVLAQHPTIADKVFSELDERHRTALAAGDRQKVDVIGYGRAMFGVSYREHLTASL